MEMQTYTHIEGGDWEHRCERMPDSHSLQFRQIGQFKGWSLILPYTLTPVLYCPYCGLEMETMPERVEE